MTWVDTHCHLQLDRRSPEELIERATRVDWMLVPGVDAASSSAARSLRGRHPHRLEWSAGVHPHHADRWRTDAEAIAGMAGEAAAVGETGLDYYRNLASPRAQRDSFRAQLELAAELDKPVIVHCRDAFADVYQLLDTTACGPRAVLHCWTGGRKWTRRFMELGVVFSFAGPLAFDTGEQIRLAAAVVPPGRAMLETDTPYLAPPPHRGEDNEPAWVAHTGRMLASVWGMEEEETAQSTSKTACRVFRR